MFEILPFEEKDIPHLKEITDDLVGKNYFSEEELVQIQKRSIQSGQNCSFLLIADNKIQGFRFTFPPSQWVSGKGLGLSEELWPHAKDKTAYFQSLFINPKLARKGFGKKMSLKSIEVLKSIGCLGVVCHSWIDSPNNSSGLYLRSIGFESVSFHKNYWKNIDYFCPKCGNPCLCTAEEMYLDLEKN